MNTEQATKIDDFLAAYNRAEAKAHEVKTKLKEAISEIEQLRHAAKTAGFEFIKVPQGYITRPTGPQVLLSKIKILETKQRQLIRWMLDEFNIGHDGYLNRCITGDCPHETISECIDTLLQQFGSRDFGGFGRVF